MSELKEFKEVVRNRQAFHNYEILEKFEAGLVLTGTEIKSAREGRVNLKDAYGIVKSGEIWMLGTACDASIVARNSGSSPRWLA